MDTAFLVGSHQSRVEGKTPPSPPCPLSFGSSQYTIGFPLKEGKSSQKRLPNSSLEQVGLVLSPVSFNFKPRWVFVRLTCTPGREETKLGIKGIVGHDTLRDQECQILGKTGEFFCRITAHTLSTTEGIWWEKGSRVLWDPPRDLSSLVPTTQRGVCSEDVKRCHEVPGGETGGFQGCREKGPAEHHRTEKMTPKPFTSPLPFS